MKEKKMNLTELVEPKPKKSNHNRNRKPRNNTGRG